MIASQMENCNEPPVGHHDTTMDCGGARQIWAATVNQALEDLDEQPYGSLIHDEAVAFFTRGGIWGHRRDEVAAYLDLHADDLRRIGQGRIDARATREPPPPVQPRQPTVQSATRPSPQPSRPLRCREQYVAAWLQKWMASAA